MRENRRKRNQISEMSFPRYERVNRGEKKKTEYMQDFRLLPRHR
jgi:hypothetical protein